MIYKPNEIDIKSQYCQTMVFNTNDLMCLIFEYVRLDDTFTGDLINCSLVNSHWLYQSWNPNSIYSLVLDTLIKNTIEYITNGKSRHDLDRILSSKWQRVVNVKSPKIGLYESYALETLQYLLEKICTLRKIVDIDLRILDDDDHIALFKVLVYYNKENIQNYLVIIRCNKPKNKLTPLKLLNGKNVYIRNAYYYYIMWSYKCQILRLNLDSIDDDWIRYVIDNCDCSGIKQIIIEHMSFSRSLNLSLETKSGQLLLNKFAQKFENLENFTVTQYVSESNRGLILLLRYLNPIIKMNNATVGLQIVSSFTDCNQMVNMIQDTGIKICRLDVWIDDKASINCLKPIVLNNPYLEYLAIDNWIEHENVVEKSILDLLVLASYESEKGSLQPLSSLKMMEIGDRDLHTNIDTINRILGLKLIDKYKLCTKMGLDINYSTHYSNFFKESFEKMCQTAASLLISQQIPLEIHIMIDNMKKSLFDNTFYPIFQQYLDPDATKNSKPPIVNKYCEVLLKPRISLQFESYRHDRFSVDDPNGTVLCQVSNVKKNFEHHDIY